MVPKNMARRVLLPAMKSELNTVFASPSLNSTRKLSNWMVAGYQAGGDEDCRQDNEVLEMAIGAQPDREGAAGWRIDRRRRHRRFVVRADSFTLTRACS